MNQQTTNSGNRSRTARVSNDEMTEQTAPPNTTGEPVIPTTRGTRTKTQLLIGLLDRIEGATLEQMVEATGWLPHTTRAALTGLKKKEYAITSEKANGTRVYRIVGSAR